MSLKVQIVNIYRPASFFLASLFRWLGRNRYAKEAEQRTELCVFLPLRRVCSKSRVERRRTGTAAVLFFV